ncbi:MAG: GtrA family protein [Myxococcales bacterium]|nr:GtrA family protein [Myxococcales bacterium]
MNRLTAFRYARGGDIWKQFVGFCLASSGGALVQFTVATYVLTLYPPLRPQGAALVGIAAGMLINFTVNRYFVFKAKHPVAPKPPAPHSRPET